VTGKRFGSWVVISGPLHVKGNDNHKFYRVKCECGKEKFVRIFCLRDGSSTSCGCSKAPKKESSLRGLLYYYKYSAHARNISWRLSRTQFEKLISENCYYCGDCPKIRMKKSGYNQ
jgi:hypothetical protein